MDSSTLVIKASYGETLRRFNARVENGQLDLDMNDLKAKVLSLFEIPPDADLTITYVDEDGDVVTLIEDEDLRDVMRQNLKFLRINVVLNSEKSGRSYAGSTGSSTPLRSPRLQRPLSNVKAAVAEALKSVPDPLPHVNAVVTEALRSIPDPLGDNLQKLYADLLSKASSSNPAMSDFVNMFVSMAESYATTAMRSPTVGQTGGQNGVAAGSAEAKQQVTVDSKAIDKDAEPIILSRDSSSRKGKEVDAGDGPASSATPVKASAGLNSELSDKLDLAKETYNALLLKNGKVTGNNPAQLLPKSSLTGQEHPVKTPVSSSADAVKNDGTSGKPFFIPPGAAPAMPMARPTLGMRGFPGECPFSGMTFPNPGGVLHGSSHPAGAYGHSGIVFHKGVRCDGCGVHPITGPRFKSKVKENFDLCSLCFSTMGKVEDYIRLDRPIPYGAFRHGRPPVRGLYDQYLWPAPPSVPQILKGCRTKIGKPKLDSRFVADVTVMDGTVMAPSTPFTKIWRMRNNGGFVWLHGTQLVWIGGDKFSDTAALELEIPADGVPMEGELDVAIDFMAPNSPGRYISYWRMASPSGQKFGQRIWVLIQVDASLDNSVRTGMEDLNLNLPAENQPLDGLFGETGNDGSNLLGDMELTGGPVEAQIPAASLTGSSSSGDGGSRPSTASSSSISYPKIDTSEAHAFPVVATPPMVVPKAMPVASAPSEEVTGNPSLEVEATMLRELEEMGFKQVDLNKEILRMNAYDLEQSVEALCGVSEWDPILEELQEMGFSDKEMNKMLLKKNNGSIKRVVMDLITGEKA
ncbi:hypothetical protein MLD38_026110 [Melastoma candidum]|uniref:Uncharacterized protein n=1 Tax=Melastoma candidum TaxID=119954 RepID=A0ACB9NXJ6_9MYRT|nr:hypothetical protein MLD38_026110 [Melastoma candidum]